MAIIPPNTSWHSSNTSPASSVGHKIISLGTATVEVSALAAAILKKEMEYPTTAYEKAMLVALKERKPLLYQKIAHYTSLVGQSAISTDMVSLCLWQNDLAFYGASTLSNSSTPITPQQTMEENTSPATKPVILINQDKRKLNTSTKVV